jgi:hypothetical protein
VRQKNYPVGKGRDGGGSSGGSRDLDLATNDHNLPHTKVVVATRPHEEEAHRSEEEEWGWAARVWRKQERAARV